MHSSVLLGEFDSVSNQLRVFCGKWRAGHSARNLGTNEFARRLVLAFRALLDLASHLMQKLYRNLVLMQVVLTWHLLLSSLTWFISALPCKGLARLSLQLVEYWQTLDEAWYVFA